MAGPLVVRPATTNCTTVVYSPVYGPPWEGGGGYSGTEGGHTCIMYFAEEGVFF